MEPSTATLVGGLTSLLPWSIKPLYGLMTDAVPICGYRRKPYTIIGGAVMTLCWFGMALCTTELWHAIIFLTLGNVAAAAVKVSQILNSDHSPWLKTLAEGWRRRKCWAGVILI